MNKQDLYIKRCFDLAMMATAGYTSPNPQVGSVLVKDDKIIGEGLHEVYGSAHAEVNCINSVTEQDKPLIPDSKIYVSLEPCCIYGKTPPCSDLILKNNIKEVCIPNLDSTPGVSGQSVALLRSKGCKVTFARPDEGKDLFKVRDTFVSKKRPYIILKYAVSRDGFMGQKDKNIWLTNSISKRLVHKWRAEVSAIMVGTNTAISDNPALTNRLYFGKNPLRIVIDRQLKLTSDLHLLDQNTPTWIITEQANNEDLPNLKYQSLSFNDQLLNQLLDKLFSEKINTLLVEGGATLLQHFIDQNLWDEARVFEASKVLKKGIKGPSLDYRINPPVQIGKDQLYMLRNKDRNDIE